MRKQTIIDAESTAASLDLREFLQYRDLFLTLAHRDLRVRYAQSFLGVLWAFMQPAITLCIFTVIFSQALSVETSGVPYPLYASAGLIAWTFFAYVMTNAGGSIIGAQSMIKKIYFPRLIIPLSKAIVGLVDFFVAFLIYVGLALHYGHAFTSTLFWLPLFIAGAIVTGLAVGIWLSALTIRYRDFQYVIPFMVQIGMWLTPVAYPARMLPRKFLSVYFLNPMVGVLDGFRWCLVDGPPLDGYSYVSFGVMALLFVTSIYYFKRVEKQMADLV
ncbi:MAG: ABC transporter permease [Fimbriimonadaceae bacterium]|nr:ABC transporter permease [Fimbriimonadaceae bacterium]